MIIGVRFVALGARERCGVKLNAFIHVPFYRGTWFSEPMSFLIDSVEFRFLQPHSYVCLSNFALGYYVNTYKNPISTRCVLVSGVESLKSFWITVAIKLEILLKLIKVDWLLVVYWVRCTYTIGTVVSTESVNVGYFASVIKVLWFIRKFHAIVPLEVSLDACSFYTNYYRAFFETELTALIKSYTRPREPSKLSRGLWNLSANSKVLEGKSVRAIIRHCPLQ